MLISSALSVSAFFELAGLAVPVGLAAMPRS